jgi:hypothetical protein
MECKSCGNASHNVHMVVCDKCGGILHTPCVHGGATQLDPNDEWLCTECQLLAREHHKKILKSAMKRNVPIANRLLSLGPLDDAISGTFKLWPDR